MVVDLNKKAIDKIEKEKIYIKAKQTKSRLKSVFT